MEEEEEFKIEEVKEFIYVPKKQKVSLSEKILRRFLETNYKRAKITVGKKALGVSRAIPKVIKKLGLENKVAYRGKVGDSIQLERLDL